MRKPSFPIMLSPSDQTQLEQWESAHGTPQQVGLRCRIVLAALAGEQNQTMAARLQVSRPTVNLWRKRVRDRGIGQVWEMAPGRGRKPLYDQTKRDAIVEATLQTKPKGMTHWSCRTMAEEQNVSKDTVNRLWQMHHIKPHRSRTFKLSRDTQFLEKLTDVVGLYLNPPQKAVVLCLDEKSQIQALDRTQPGLPLKKGRCGTMTHDYKRNGTTTLFAALSLLDGKVIGECHARHRHQEWLKFLRRLDREFPLELELHLVIDNYGTHKEPHVRAWLKKHRRFVCHFIPTSSSWLNLVERWFAELSAKAIRRGSFVSVPDLQEAIERFLEAWNQKPKPFIWTAKVEDIMQKIERARAKLEQIKPGCTQPRGKKKTIGM
ncbi:MAG: IS630 family transposase [Verrucomicrobiae bacterium]|nr:IS630 family transposase [Verrucomicrobiae bacterium]